MALIPADVQRLEERAVEVGGGIGWELHFHVLPNPQYVALSAGSDGTVIYGPAKVAELAAHEVEFLLDALERGDSQLIEDDQGDLRIITP